jgi:hypothetical protein
LDVSADFFGHPHKRKYANISTHAYRYISDFSPEFGKCAECVCAQEKGDSHV